MPHRFLDVGDPPVRHAAAGAGPAGAGVRIQAELVPGLGPIQIAHVIDNRPESFDHVHLQGRDEQRGQARLSAALAGSARSPLSVRRRPPPRYLPRSFATGPSTPFGSCSSASWSSSRASRFTRASSVFNVAVSVSWPGSPYKLCSSWGSLTRSKSSH